MSRTPRPPLLTASASAPAPPASVAEAAAAHLRVMLFEATLRPGEELRDTDIAGQLGIARPTARAAVAALVAEGLLERRPGHSARVRRFTAADIHDIHRVRRLVETEAVRAIIVDGLDTTPIREALDAFRRVGDRWEAGPDADVRFHHAVVAATGSERLARTFQATATEMRLLVAGLRDRYRSLGELYDEHDALLAALEAGDLGAALRAWEEHLADAERFLAGALAHSAAGSSSRGLAAPDATCADPDADTTPDSLEPA